MTTVATAPMDRWETLPWKQIQRNVFKLQKRIYRAAGRDDVRTVHRLQRLLVKSRSARLLAVRRVAQENQGKRSAGIDGVKSLTPPQRLALAQTLKLGQKAQPVRRVWVPKPQSTELRPLGIPVMANRAGQALATAALEPEWEARFEPNSYGFRPGRSGQDAIDAIFASIAGQAKYVLDADIAHCFDHLSHSAILTAVHTSPSIRCQLKAWLKAGVVENGELFPTPVGTIQGGNISPLLINIALHGLETLIGKRFRRNGCTGFNSPRVIRYADDIVILHRDEHIVRQCQELVSAWLKERGLELKPSKTRITPTLAVPQGVPGFAFLGFAIRHYPVGKTRSAKDTRGRLLGYKTRIVPSPEAIQHHVQQLRLIIKSHRHASQEALIRLLNPVIVGWARYYARVGSARIFQSLDNRLYGMLRAWAVYRHPNKGKRWIARRYWCLTTGHGWIFQPPHGELRLYRHGQTPIRRHVKVHGVRSPYDGDGVYWSIRLGQHPEVPPRVARLLKRQQGKCAECGLFFAEGDRMEVDHIIPQGSGGLIGETTSNCSTATVTIARRRATLAVRVRVTNVTSLRSRVRGQPSSTVLEPSRGGDIPA